MPLLNYYRMNFREIYNLLYGHFGPQDWWPGDSYFEYFIGCILAQNTRWERVVPVIERMKSRGITAPSEFLQLDPEELAQVIRESGTYRRKAEYLQVAGNYMLSIGWNGSPDSVTIATERLRNELLSLKGIGPETCDCILLYVLERPVFVVDAYTKRILLRHSLCDREAGYSDIQQLFTDSVETDIEVYKEYHALIVECAKKYCRPKPLCADCPLNEGIQYCADKRKRNSDSVKKIV